MKPERNETARAPRRGMDRSWWLTVLGIFVALGVMALGSAALLASRNDIWRQAQDSAGNLLLALDRDIVRNVSVLDLSLQGVIEALAEPGIDQVSPSIRQHALFDRSASAEDLGSILVLDPEGKVVADSTDLVPHPLDLSDRDYFRVHDHEPDVGLYVSRAFSSRLANGDLRFAISRRIDGPGGEFAGVVSATLRLNYFRRLFEKLNIGTKGTISLIRTDGRVLLRYPFRDQDVDLDLGQSPNYKRFVAARSGQYVARATIDGVERLFTFRRLGDLPLILSVSLSTEEILEPWRQKALVIGPAMLLLCICAVASSLLFGREIRRRARFELALAEANEQLRVTASTDGLTGLMNRRAFDVEYDRSFRGTVRTGATLAILMIDADYFKRFNDSHGHVAGDAVLRAIAGCLEASLRRPYDRAARYGGEEFVVIFPDTDETAALALGERIRAAVAALQIQHSASPIGIVSISIGVAARSPLIGDDPQRLLRRADESLYAAKQAGRNCVRALGDPEPAADLGLLVQSAIMQPTSHNTFRTE